MATLEEVIRTAQGISDQIAAEQPNLDPEVRVRYALIDAIFQLALGRGAPGIISGYRSLRDQRRLRREGRPAARRSWHTLGRAIDLEPLEPQDLDHFADLWELTGGRAGRTFTQPDINHFDLPGPVEPPPAW